MFCLNKKKEKKSTNVPTAAHHDDGILSSSLRFVYKTELFSDYKIIINSRTIPCHKVILACRSSFFLALFQSQMQDANNSSIHLKDFNDKAVKKCVEFMYTNLLDDVYSKEELIELMNVGSFLGVENISSSIAEKLKTILSNENVCEIFQKSYEHNSENVKDLCIKFIIENFNLIVKLEDFIDLPKECMKNVLTQYTNGSKK
eukprot:gene10954-3662_t